MSENVVFTSDLVEQVRLPDLSLAAKASTQYSIHDIILMLTVAK